MNRFVITPIDAPSYHVHVHEDDALAYKAIFTITEYEDGARIHASGLHGVTLMPDEYRAFAREHFPRAVKASYDRLTRHGMRREVVGI